MGIGYAFKQLLQGNVENAFNGVWVPDSNLEAIDQASSNLDRIIQQHEAEGLIDADQASRLYALQSPNTNSDAFWSTDGPSPATVFEDTLEEQANAIGQFGSNAINKVVGLGAKIIPWQVYALLFVLVLVWAYPFWKPFAEKIFSKK